MTTTKNCKNHGCAKLLMPETADKILAPVSSAAFCPGPKYQWLKYARKPDEMNLQNNKLLAFK